LQLLSSARRTDCFDQRQRGENVKALVRGMNFQVDVMKKEIAKFEGST